VPPGPAPCPPFDPLAPLFAHVGDAPGARWTHRARPARRSGG
jgi:hypothetical protein